MTAVTLVQMWPPTAHIDADCTLDATGEITLINSITVTVPAGYVIDYWVETGLLNRTRVASGTITGPQSPATFTAKTPIPAAQLSYNASCRHT
jgi:hypothetical protein